MDRQRTNQGLGSTTKTAQAPAEPIRPPEVNRVDPARDDPEDRAGERRDRRDPTRPHPGSPQTPQ